MHHAAGRRSIPAAWMAALLLTSLLAGVPIASAAGFVTQTLVMPSTGVTDTDVAGYAVAMDERFLVEGARNADFDGFWESGAVYLFDHGPAWVEAQVLTSPQPSNAAYFGHDVAIDGDTLLVSASGGRVDGGTPNGAAYVYRLGSNWTLEATLSVPGSTADNFGWSVALDGDRAIVGAYRPNTSGRAYVFERSGTTWSHTATLVPADPAGQDWFGWTVALDGTTALVGRNNVGSAAYVFTLNGGTWSQQAKLLPALAGDVFGFGNDIALDGNRAAVQTFQDNDFQNPHRQKGAVIVFERAGTAWSQVARLTASDSAPFDRFGESLALRGNLLVGGATFHKVNGQFSGAAYVFERIGGVWTETQKLLPTAAAGNTPWFGRDVAITACSIAVGAYGADAGGIQDRGGVYVFEMGDSDGEGLSDCAEVNVHGTDPLKPDTDDDLLDDFEEVVNLPTDPLDPDTDDDVLLDGQEVLTYLTDPVDPDTEDDGLLDGDEVLVFACDPFDPDTDGDLFGDRTESYGSAPLFAAGAECDDPLSLPTPLTPINPFNPPLFTPWPILDDLEPLF